MRTINLSNEKSRNAQVGFEIKRRKSDIELRRNDGMDYENVRLLKLTVDTDIDRLLQQHGSANRLAHAIISSDPEVNMEKVGMKLRGVRKVFLDDEGRIACHISRQEVLYTPKGEERDVRKFKDSEANVNIDVPLRWTGKLIPKGKAARMFVFTRKYQVKHVNGLTFDFLYDMASKLHEADSVMLLGSGAKGTGPVVFSNGGSSYRAFLEGRIQDNTYCLILHLTNLELKTLES